MDDAELIKQALRAVLMTEGDSAKLAGAKAQAARQLGILTGALPQGQAGDGADAEAPPDPFEDLDELEAERQRRARRRRTKPGGDGFDELEPRRRRRAG